MNALRAFESAARHLSFTRAADELHVTAAVVSQQIKLLEEQLGMRLFLREGNVLHLTAAGEAYLPGVRESFDRLMIATDELTSRRSGVLRVATPPTFDAKWLVPRLYRFTAQYPDIHIQVVATSVADFTTGEVDVAIDCGRGKFPGMHVERFITDEVSPECSPGLLTGPHPLRTVADLAHHTLLHDKSAGTDPSCPDWGRWLAGAGVRATATSGSTDALAAAVRTALSGLVAAQGRPDLVLASGMITSPLGLVEIPHLEAPCGLDDLAAGMCARVIPAIMDSEIWFVPGVRNPFPDDRAAAFAEIDFMRGEEVEAIGLAARLGLAGPACIVLPGSHNKILMLDEAGRIARSTTSLSGEMIAALSGQTVLADTLKGRFAPMLLPDWLARGADLAAAQGLTRAAFSVRAAAMYGGTDANAAVNLLLGAVLQADVVLIRNFVSGAPAGTPLILAGGQPLTGALAGLIRRRPSLASRLREIAPPMVRNIAGYGAVVVAARRGLLTLKSYKMEPSP